MLWYLGAHHIASTDELGTFIGHFSFAMQRVGLAYVFYLAIEPYARRLWPRMLVSWVRVLEGRFRDPLVGRDLLLGSATGALLALTGILQAWIPAAFGGAFALPAHDMWTTESLRGPVHAFVSVVGVHTQQLLEIIFPLTMLLIFRLVLRRTGLAIAAVSLLVIVLFFPDSGSVSGYLVGVSVAIPMVWFLLFRVGLLAFATMFFVSALLENMPMTLQPAGWYAGAMFLSIAFIVAPALYGFWTSQAGRPFFRDELLEPAARR
jgi:serine/threonine-protein kinase